MLKTTFLSAIGLVLSQEFHCKIDVGMIKFTINNKSYLGFLMTTSNGWTSENTVGILEECHSNILQNTMDKFKCNLIVKETCSDDCH